MSKDTNTPSLMRGVGKTGVSRRGDRRVLIEVKEPGQRPHRGRQRSLIKVQRHTWAWRQLDVMGPFLNQ